MINKARLFAWNGQFDEAIHLLDEYDTLPSIIELSAILSGYREESMRGKGSWYTWQAAKTSMIKFENPGRSLQMLKKALTFSSKHIEVWHLLSFLSQDFQLADSILWKECGPLDRFPFGRGRHIPSLILLVNLSSCVSQQLSLFR
eukprot:187539-Hanusia_phi.AAC.4